MLLLLCASAVDLNPTRFNKPKYKAATLMCKVAELRARHERKERARERYQEHVGSELPQVNGLTCECLQTKVAFVAAPHKRTASNSRCWANITVAKSLHDTTLLYGDSLRSTNSNETCKERAC